MGNGKSWWILVGGRHRLGGALAERLAGEHNLVLTSSKPWDDCEPWLEELSKERRVRRLRWDAEDPRLANTMMADMDALGTEGIQLECAILVAGTFPEQRLGTWDAGGLERTWRLNLSFPLLAAQAVAPRIQDGGCLQVLLDTAIHRPWLKRLPYSAAKAGLAAMVPALAQLLAPRVRVVGHALGTVLPGSGDDAAFLANRTLLRRLGDPDDLVRALRYAAESPFLTGEILTLDGGRRWI